MSTDSLGHVDRVAGAPAHQWRRLHRFVDIGSTYWSVGSERATN
ncbi:hypothetical protein [Salinispora tropica]|nr:hypothetical protein [Salinispora tropica]